MTTRLWRAATLCGAILMVAPAALAQTTTQLWFNFTLDKVKSDRLVYELDFEPKGLVHAPEGEPDWRNFDVTPNVEFSPKGWLDLVGEATVGYTRQTDDVNSAEVTPRVGIRLHFLSRDRVFGRERLPKRRVVFRDLLRVESRNFFYSGEGTGSSSTVRFRNRVEFLAPLNKQKMTEDGARYVLADWEWFIPVDDPDERFANRQRIRTGLGYRHSFAWRYEFLYMWTRSRDTIDEGFSTTENIIDVRIKHLF